MHQMTDVRSKCGSLKRYQIYLVVVCMFQWCLVDGLETQSLPLETRVCRPFKSPTATFWSARLDADTYGSLT
jgi:hypothetical protein